MRPAQAFRFDMFNIPLPRSAVGYGTAVAVIRCDGLSACCDAPRKMRLVTNGKRTEKCANCGAEAIRE